MPPQARYCTCCQTERKKRGMQPRAMTSISLHKMEKDYYMCVHCDGDALLMAKQLEQQREKK